MNKKFNFENTGNVKFMVHAWDEDLPSLEIISRFKDCGDIVYTYIDKELWLGCFGIMSVIIIDSIKCRQERQHLERIFAR